MAEIRSVTRTMVKAAPRDRGCEASRDRAPRHHGRGSSAPGSAETAGEIQTERPPVGGHADLLRWDHDGTPARTRTRAGGGEGAYRLTGALSCGRAMQCERLI